MSKFDSSKKTLDGLKVKKYVASRVTRLDELAQSVNVFFGQLLQNRISFPQIWAILFHG
jgi:hypothetical protein